MQLIEDTLGKPLGPFGCRLTAVRPSQKLADLDTVALDGLLAAEKLVLLRGFEPPSREEFLAWCRSFPQRSLLEWDFGPVMEMHERPDPKNYLFSREAVPYHWDGAFHRVPSYLAFSCVDAPDEGAGGETLFCNTELVWTAADQRDRALWNDVALTYETAKLAHYGGRITGALVQAHPRTGARILRFAEPVDTRLNPVSLTVHGLKTKEEAVHVVADLARRAYHPAFCYEHRWQTGDILLADNHSLIHGRRAFENGSPRHLRRIQII